MPNVEAPDGPSFADTEHAARNLATARRYLEAIERRGPPEQVLAFYTDDAVQVELPNRLVPRGARRDVAALREASERGRRVISAERYEVRSATAAGERVVLEVRWLGTVAIPLGGLAVGDEMRAHFAMVLDFRDGRIVAQRNYDCFEEF
jgi:ketosteroid isomerase-like protein